MYTRTVTYTLYKILCPVFKPSSPPRRTTPLPIHTTPRASGAPLVMDWIRSVMWPCQNWPWVTGSTLTTWELTQCQPSPPSMAFWDPRHTTMSARPIGTSFHSYSLMSRPESGSLGPNPKPTPAWIAFSITRGEGRVRLGLLEAIYAMDEVWGRD